VHILDSKQLIWAAMSQLYFNLEMQEKYYVFTVYLHQTTKRIQIFA
jgi:hypothetical protein